MAIALTLLSIVLPLYSVFSFCPHLPFVSSCICFNICIQPTIQRLNKQFWLDVAYYYVESKHISSNGPVKMKRKHSTHMNGLNHCVTIPLNKSKEKTLVLYALRWRRREATLAHTKNRKCVPGWPITIILCVMTRGCVFIWLCVGPVWEHTLRTLNRNDPWYTRRQPESERTNEQKNEKKNKKK